MTREEAWRILETADLVRTAEEVEEALDRLAAEITKTLAEKEPLVLTVMGGAVVFAGRLLPRLRFPLECDFLHATRYRESLSGAAIHWRVEPEKSVAGRTVLVLDDILDEGITLAAIRERLLAQGAAECRLAVLAEKETGRPKPIVADFVGLTVPNRYVFGCGMDVKGYWRNLPGIHAVKGS